MKNCGLPTALACGLAFCASAFSCPMFVEFFPDPKNVSDDEGEYVEIRLDDYRADSLFVRFESKGILAFQWPDAERLLLVHDTAQCPQGFPSSSSRNASMKNVACASLGKISLPNSRESVWKLWSGSCVDSVTVPTPKAGKAIQRVGLTDEWAFVVGTKGSADPEYEFGIEDCSLGRLSAEYDAHVWNISAFVSGCDSAVVHVRSLDVWGREGWLEKDYVVHNKLSLKVAGDASGGALWFHAELPEDAAPNNNVLDTLFVSTVAAMPNETEVAERLLDFSPLRVTEVHHCPEEPMPEWVELYNASAYPLPLESFRFCERGGALGKEGDSLLPFQTVLISKDTLSLRTSLAIPDIRMIQVSLGFLNNVEGSLRLCFQNDVVDSVYWNKTTVSCPAGFNPLTSRREFTPGFQQGLDIRGISLSSTPGTKDGTAKNGSVLQIVPFVYKLSSRVVSKKGGMFRVHVESEYDVSLSLLDSAGRRVWKTVVSSMSNEWVNVPVRENLGIGVGYVALAVGEYENVVGILVRP